MGKKTIGLAALLALVCATGAFAASDGWYVVGNATNSVMAAPATRVRASAVSAFSTNTYAQGSYVLSGTMVYWTPNGGAATNAPTHNADAGTVAGADGVYWKAIDGNGRVELVVYADIAATAYVSPGNPVRMSGDVLDALSRARIYGREEQQAVYLKGAGTFHVSER